jgi:protein involved in polysaccharide export with SLBB domain
MLPSKKTFYRMTIMVLFCTFFSFISYAQLTPEATEQIKQMIPAGIDPTQLTKGNFDALLRENNQQQSEAGQDKNKELDSEKKAFKQEIIKDSTQQNGKDKKKLSGLETYGYNVFSDAAKYDIAELSTPPLDYPIGVGDHIVVSLWGGGEDQQDYVVTKDGSIFPSGIGKIIVQGLTFEHASDIIKAKFRSRTPGNTRIQVTMGQPRTLNINVVGEVINPGPKTLSAFSNAFNAIGLAGGVTDYGNLREIIIKRGGKTIETLDVYKYLNSGEIGQKIYLQNNDFVIVGFVNKKILATGQFKRPMYYQLKKEEGMRDLIKYTGGFSSEAFTSGVKVIRTENEKQLIHDVNCNAITQLAGQDYPLYDGDVVKVDLIRPGIINKVELQGAVVYPGIYEIRPNDRLFDVINRAGGITPNAFLKKAFVFRGAGDSTNVKADKLEMNLTDFSKNEISSANNILLQANDVIRIFSNKEFSDVQYVEIFGEVRQGGRVNKFGGMTLKDLLYLSGGLKPSAEFGRLEISSVVDTDSASLGIKPVRTVLKSYAIFADLEIDSSASSIVLRPYDQIYVRKNPTFELQENVTIEGLVKYPGTYPRLEKNERLTSFIERAGGLLENADISGVLLKRNKKMQNANLGTEEGAMEPISINFEKAMRNKESSFNVAIQKGDVISIPEKNPFVAVTGNVQSPLRLAYQKNHSKTSYYIGQAGGYNDRPWRRRIYVTYANGTSRRTRNFFFIHFHPKVKEGTTIIVPQRPEIKEGGASKLLTQSIMSAIPIAITYLILKLLK